MAEEVKNTGINSFDGAEKDEQYLLVVKNLKKYFPIKSSFFKKTIGHVKAVEYLNREQGIDIINLGTGTPYSVLELVNAFQKVKVCFVLRVDL